MCGTADSLMVTQYVLYSRQFNADTVCSDANVSVHNESATVQCISAIYCSCVLTEQHSDRRNSKYRQQTEKQRAVNNKSHIKTNSTNRIINVKGTFLKRSLFSAYRLLLCWIDCLVHTECCCVELFNAYRVLLFSIELFIAYGVLLCWIELFSAHRILLCWIV